MMLHGQVLYSLLNEIEPVDFKELAGLEKDQNFKLNIMQLSV
jgi:hypothetical protein